MALAAVLLAAALAACGGATTPRVAPVPRHIDTWAYDDGCNGGSGASAALVRAWLTYAETHCRESGVKALDDCRTTAHTYCRVLQYVNANKVYDTDDMRIVPAAQESWWLHEPGYGDGAHRLTGENPLGTWQLLDQSNRAVDRWVRGYVRKNFGSWDGLMMDDVAGTTREQFYGSGHASSNEIGTDAEVIAEHGQIAREMTKADGSRYLQVDNGLNINPYLPASALALYDNSSEVVGLVAEGNPWYDGMSDYFSTLLDDIAYVNAREHADDFLVLLSYDSDGAPAGRRVQEATMLLGYSPGHLVDWAELEQNSPNLAVWPEEGIYPTGPIQTMGAPGGADCMKGTGSDCAAGGHNDLEVAPGVYRREFRACYDRGAEIGACAAIVNDTGGTVTIKGSWLSLSYTSRIGMTGGDVQSGGTVDVHGARFQPDGTTIAPHDAVLLSGPSPSSSTSE